MSNLNIKFGDLNPAEHELLINKEFIKRKISLSNNIESSLLSFAQQIKPQLISNPNLPKEYTKQAFKVIKGENYSSFPYWVLDYPKCFQNKQFLFCRIMIWWGEQVNSSLILSRKYIDLHKFRLLSNYELLVDKGYFFQYLISSSWINEWNNINYRSFHEISKAQWQTHIDNCAYLKITKSIPIKHLNKFDKFLIDCSEDYIKLLEKD